MPPTRAETETWSPVYAVRLTPKGRAALAENTPTHADLRDFEHERQVAWEDYFWGTVPMAVYQARLMEIAAAEAYDLTLANERFLEHAAAHGELP